MEKREIFIAIAFILIIGLFICFVPNMNLNMTGNAVGRSSSGSFVKPVITKDNFQQTLQSQSIIQELPKKAIILLVLSDTGDNTGENPEDEYIITRGSVKQVNAENPSSNSNPDLIIFIPSKYIPESYNFCNAIKQANKNRDLEYELKESKASLLWKYRGMLKYKECLF